MNKSVSELLNNILAKTKYIEAKIADQQKEIEVYISKLSVTSQQISVLIANMKLLQASVRLLIYEVQEVYNFINSEEM